MIQSLKVQAVIMLCILLMLKWNTMENTIVMVLKELTKSSEAFLLMEMFKC